MSGYLYYLRETNNFSSLIQKMIIIESEFQEKIKIKQDLKIDMIMINISLYD